MSTPKIRNSRGNWWYADDPCAEEGCDTLIDSCDNEYAYYAEGQRIIRCRKHYDYRGRERSTKSNPLKNAISARAIKKAGGKAAYDALPKQGKERKALRAEARAEILSESAITVSITEHSNVVPFPKEDFGPRTPMTRRKSTEVTGEKVNEGWVYIVRNPEVPQHLKIGKTFPNGIGDIMTSARRYGRAELLFKCEAAHAEHAEKKIAHVELSEYNLRNRGYADVGTEVFEVPLEKAIEVVKMACDIVNDPEWEGAKGDANET